MSGEINPITFPSANGEALLEGKWYLPTRRATNAALLVSQERQSLQALDPLPEICAGAAALGLTVLSFNFRFGGKGPAKQPEKEDLDDLFGAYNFLQSFGREIKPRRCYLLGQGEAGRVCLKAVNLGGPLEGLVSGIILAGVGSGPQTGTTYREKAAGPEISIPVISIQGDRIIKDSLDWLKNQESGREDLRK